MALLCYHKISIDIIKLCDHQKHFIERVSLSMKLYSVIFVGNGGYTFCRFMQ